MFFDGDFHGQPILPNRFWTRQENAMDINGKKK
jgi:hypothetical protein